VLGNDENRKKYDDLGANWKQAQQSGGDPGFDFSQFYNQAGGQRSHHQTYQSDPEDFSEFFNIKFHQLNLKELTGTQVKTRSKMINYYKVNNPAPYIIPLKEIY